MTVEYDMKTICGTKEELPFLTPEEYEFGLSMTPDDEIVQVRIPNGRISKYTILPSSLIEFTLFFS